MKINYHEQALETIKKIHEESHLPTLLVHACCGPCACYPLEFLLPHFKITVLFNNSNIYPSNEHNRRFEELFRYVHHLNQSAIIPIQLILANYNNEEFTQKISIFKNEPERGKRCLLCYRLRMNEGFLYAQENKFDYYTTIMTVSRQKDSQILNQIGTELQLNFPSVQYFASDFKKNDGNLKGKVISQSLNMYRQDYCGCIYSYQNHKEGK